MARHRGFMAHFDPGPDVEMQDLDKSLVQKACAAMDEEMIRLWNDTVTSPEDVVYHLGDFSFRGARETSAIIRRLNGRIRLVRGNHDKVIKGELLKQFEWVKDYYEAAGPGKTKIVLMHYPLEVWNRSHYGAWMCHGHSHGSLVQSRDIKRHDVGVDTNDLRPYALPDLENIMRNKGYDAVDHHTKR